MNEKTIQDILEAKFNLEGLEFEFNDGEKVVFSSPEGDIEVFLDEKEVYNQEGYLGKLN